MGLFSWLRLGTASLWMNHIYQLIMCYPATVNVFKTLFNPWGKPFHVTAKGLSQARTSLNFEVAWPLIALFFLYCAGFIYKGMTIYWDDEWPVFSVICAWSIFNFLLIWLSILACADVPQQRRVPRFSRALRGSLVLGSKTFATTTVDVSEEGALVKIRGILDPDAPGEAVLVFPDIKSGEISAEIVRWVPAHNLVAVKYRNLNTVQYRALIESLYCRPRSWALPRVCERRMSWKLLVSVFRLYPFAETR
jgi:cellulose synthase (UDP-forming)